MASAEPDGIIERYPESDRAWAQDFGLAMWLNDLTDSQSDQELENALAAIRDSGQGAEDLFGDPSEYGEVRSYARLTPQQLADSEMSINSSVLLLAGFGLVVGLLCAGFGTWVGFRDGWASNSWHYWQLAALSAGTGIALSGHLWWLYRLKGRFARSWTLGLAGIVVSIAAAAIIAVLGGEEAMQLPNWLAPILGIALAVGVFWLPFNKEPAAPRNCASAFTDPETWFAESTRLLRGRYGMRGKEAASALEPAREHWSNMSVEGGEATIVEEFGTPGEFTIGLGVNTANALKRRWLMRRLLPLALVVLYGTSLLPEVLAPDRSGWDIFFGVCILIYAVITLYELRSANRAEYVQSKLAERRAHARGLEEGRDE
ncbi:hypothetical protein ACX5K5_08670 [Glutamicibacter bergerei]|uniref:Uncharacterized protein n=2 Tax=Glutamicibacter TaxID=1742989 RepID=A0ABV9MI15_9MICC|nr:hypothetical protein [Glutamicibacter ardleyensis]GGJ65429.1 hypothetical protein GCM10007173_25430 [Glutamicibacter ardleyensis]